MRVRYIRTCNECGYSWEVPRAVARRGIRGMSALRVEGEVRSLGTGAVEAEIGQRADEMESFRICAKCGVDDFRQSRVRS